VNGTKGAVNCVVFKTQIFTFFHALMPSFNHFIICGSVSLQLRKNNNRFFHYGGLYYVLCEVGNCNDFIAKQYIECAHNFSLYVFYTQSYHRPQFNAQCASSDSSSFQSLFCYCYFIFGSLFDCISMFFVG